MLDALMEGVGRLQHFGFTDVPFLSVRHDGTNSVAAQVWVDDGAVLVLAPAGMAPVAVMNGSLIVQGVDVGASIAELLRLVRQTQTLRDQCEIATTVAPTTAAPAPPPAADPADVLLLQDSQDYLLVLAPEVVVPVPLLVAGVDVVAHLNQLLPVARQAHAEALAACSPTSKSSTLFAVYWFVIY